MLAVALCIAAVPPGFAELGASSGVAVYERARKGTSTHETLGVGVVDAPPWVVKNAFDDVVAPMAYIEEVRIVKRDDAGVVVYNRTSAPIIEDRDYTLRMWDDSFARPDGSVVWVTKWQAANELGPPPRANVVRVTVIYGELRMEPLPDGKSRVSYFVYTDPGGAVPLGLAEWGQRQAVANVFESIRARARNAKYRAVEPAKPTRVLNVDSVVGAR